MKRTENSFVKEKAIDSCGSLGTTTSYSYVYGVGESERIYIVVSRKYDQSQASSCNSTDQIIRSCISLRLISKSDRERTFSQSNIKYWKWIYFIGVGVLRSSWHQNRAPSLTKTGLPIRVGFHHRLGVKT
jgi:hypothetical protein